MVLNKVINGINLAEDEESDSKITKEAKHRLAHREILLAAKEDRIKVKALINSWDKHKIKKTCHKYSNF